MAGIGTPYPVGSGSSSAASATLVLLVTTSTAVGDAIVVGASCGLTTSTIIDVEDSQGNPYTLMGSTTTQFSQSMWASLNTQTQLTGTDLGGSDTITVTYSTATAALGKTAAAIGCSNVQASGPADVFAVNSSTGSGTPNVATGPLVVADELLIAFSTNGSGGGSMTWDAGWTEQVASFQAPPSREWASMATQVVSSNSTVTASGEITSSTWSTMVVSFPGATGGGGLQTGGTNPYATYVGARWLSPQTLAGYNTTNAKIGPVGCTKEFYGGALPSSFVGQPEDLLPAGVMAIVCYKTQTTNVASYIASIGAAGAKDPNRVVVIVFYQEPEGNYSTGAAFITDFKAQSTIMRNAINAHGLSNRVFISMDAGSFPYRAGGGAADGSYIPPASYVDVYLFDHYKQIPDGSAMLSATGSAGENVAWRNWLKAVVNAGGGNYATGVPGTTPIGLAEYGIGDGSTEANRNSQLAADGAYLKANFPPAGGNLTTTPFFCWAYWWVDDSVSQGVNQNWQFPAPGITCTTWQGFENATTGAGVTVWTLSSALHDTSTAAGTLGAVWTLRSALVDTSVAAGAVTITAALWVLAGSAASASSAASTLGATWTLASTLVDADSTAGSLARSTAITGTAAGAGVTTGLLTWLIALRGTAAALSATAGTFISAQVTGGSSATLSIGAGTLTWHAPIAGTSASAQVTAGALFDIGTGGGTLAGAQAVTSGASAASLSVPAQPGVAVGDLILIWAAAGSS